MINAAKRNNGDEQSYMKRVSKQIKSHFLVCMLGVRTSLQNKTRKGFERGRMKQAFQSGHRSSDVNARLAQSRHRHHHHHHHRSAMKLKGPFEGTLQKARRGRDRSSDVSARSD